MIMIKVNAIGDVCPIPVVKTKKAMQEAVGAETIEVLVGQYHQCSHQEVWEFIRLIRNTSHALDTDNK